MHIQMHIAITYTLYTITVCSVSNCSVYACYEGGTTHILLSLMVYSGDLMATLTRAPSNLWSASIK